MSRKETTLVRVTLGERESDVLVFLTIDQPRGAQQGEIVNAMRERGVETNEAIRGVHHALRLLHELRFVQTTGNEQAGVTWYATAEGVEAVKASDA